VSGPCTRPVSWAELADYWAGDLPPAVAERLEEHLFGCAACSAVSASMAAITEALRAEIAPLLTPDALDRLRARGLRIAENRMLPHERKRVPFPAEVDLVIHRLGGLDLSRATRVGFTLRIEGTDRVVVDIEDAPFDRATGTVLLACQHHFDVLPPHTVAEVRARDDSGAETVAEYTILHDFAPESAG
jgi:Putative zinc-finger